MWQVIIDHLSGTPEEHSCRRDRVGDPSSQSAPCCSRRCRPHHRGIGSAGARYEMRLADPFLLGVSSGASVGATAVLLLRSLRVSRRLGYLGRECSRRVGGHGRRVLRLAPRTPTCSDPAHPVRRGDVGNVRVRDELSHLQGQSPGDPVGALLVARIFRPRQLDRSFPSPLSFFWRPWFI